MGVQESIGTILRVSASLPANYNAAGFGALTYSAVGEITAIPQSGGKASVVGHTPLATGIRNKFHGEIDYGSLAVPLAFDENDAGQDILAAAFVSRAALSFEIEYPDGAIDYYTGKVFSEIMRGAAVSGVISGTVDIERIAATVHVDAP